MHKESVTSFYLKKKMLFIVPYKIAFICMGMFVMEGIAPDEGE